MKNYTCCFTGHRGLPTNKVDKIINNLEYEIECLIAKGVNNFISGGALGFGGTGQTVRYACSKGLKIINVAK